MATSRLFKHYIVKFCFRLTVFLALAAIFLISPERLDFTQGFSVPVFIFFLIVIIEIGLQINPMNNSVSHGCLKQFSAHYIEPEKGYDEGELRDALHFFNRGAIRVAVVWIAAHLVIWGLYLFDIIDVSLLVVISGFYYLSDLICVIFFCPFQKFLMFNRCCVNCRIFAWGLPMMVTPLVVINNMFSRVVCVLAFAVALRWEIAIKHHPERFWVGSNAALRCANCKDKMCKIKRPI